MKVLITAGPTREPIDAVRYIGNRSSGQMGAALAAAAIAACHEVTLILGPVSVSMPAVSRRIDVETAAQMHQAVLAEFGAHDLLIMAAAVADYRPKQVHAGKLARDGSLTIECEPTEDILAVVSRTKRPNQRTVGFSLETEANLSRAKEKLARKKLDLMVYNPTATMNSSRVQAALLWPDGRIEELPSLAKLEFAHLLLESSAKMFSKQ